MIDFSLWVSLFSPFYAAFSRPILDSWPLARRTVFHRHSPNRAESSREAATLSSCAPTSGGRPRSRYPRDLSCSPGTPAETCLPTPRHGWSGLELIEEFPIRFNLNGYDFRAPCTDNLG